MIGWLFPQIGKTFPILLNYYGEKRCKVFSNQYINISCCTTVFSYSLSHNRVRDDNGRILPANIAIAQKDHPISHWSTVEISGTHTGGLSHSQTMNDSSFWLLRTSAFIHLAEILKLKLVKLPELMKFTSGSTWIEKLGRTDIKVTLHLDAHMTSPCVFDQQIVRELLFDRSATEKCYRIL